MKTIYRVSWDNGASACGTFPHVFDSWDAANSWGEDWANESNIRDFGRLDPDNGYTYEVVSEEIPEDEDLDAHEGIDHEDTRRRNQP